MSRCRVAALALAAVIASLACAAGTQSGSSARRSNLITAEEILRVEVSTAYDAVRRLRPQWLQGRGGDRPVVYVDGQRRGSLNELELILPGDVAQMRFMSASDATTRYGTNHPGGAILVMTRR